MRTTVTTGWHVKVEADEPWLVIPDSRIGETVEQAKVRVLGSRCRDIRDAIKRHVDDVSWVDVIPETESRCSYCGAEWTEPSTTYNGGCCAEDEANNPENVTEEVTK